MEFFGKEFVSRLHEIAINDLVQDNQHYSHAILIRRLRRPAIFQYFWDVTSSEGRSTCRFTMVYRPVGKSCRTLTFKDKQVAIITLVANDEIRNYIICLCERNNYHPVVATDLEGLLRQTKRVRSAIVLIDYEIIERYGARIYSRINVACPGCEVILLCDRPHRDLIKEAMELGVYACILAPYKEWEVVTMIRNILTVKKKRPLKKSRQSQVM